MKWKFWLLLTAISTPANAEEARVWMGESHDGGATLIYGVPQSDDVQIAFVCELPDRQLVLNLPLSDGVSPGTGRVSVTISAKPIAESLTLAGKVQFFEEMGQSTVEARGRFDVALARMLKQGRELAVTVGKTTMTFPLAGSAKAMRALESACTQ